MSTDIMSADPVAGILDLMAAALLVVAALLTLAAAIGLWRLPDPLSRLHAGTKPQILGLTLVVIAIALSLRDPVVLLLLVPVVVFQLLTAPIAAHMVGRAGYRNGDFDPAQLVVDELADDIDAAREQEALEGAEGDRPGP
ncbi:monovalent cation/H(+) antiporter subunit G [Microcella frigidaquae]|uniref:Multicomponent Na+:H+ antiporter subunit G n=1 Tax=Microcella frigidaquae TaxID=424758 RepID=A0A840XBS4_9MICO|nr:monovalent cation/H(+) antiporter subunit G [Microcella frigidaquae]MBB5618594.1 multicomponent Na+:H+ antiporter subunit G [Microcella frigidaquae]